MVRGARNRRIDPVDYVLAPRKEGLISRYGAPSGREAPDALAAVWDIVLREG